MRGYFDESGTHDASRVTTIAGWIANADMWRKCLIKWQAVLDRQQLKQFHAADFDYFTRQNKWTPAEYSDFIKNLTCILKMHTLFGVSGSVVTSAYNNLPDWVRQRIGGRYHFCFHVLMHELMKRMERLVYSSQLTFIFERKDHVIGRTLDEFKSEFSHKNFGSRQLGGFFFGTKKKFPLLQTADFLVYEINKWIDESLHQQKTPREQLKLISKARKVWFGYHDEETLAGLPALLEQNREKLEAGKPSGLVWWPVSWHRNYVKEKR